MAKIKNRVDPKGQTKKITCLSCAITRGNAEWPGGPILTSEYFEAGQDTEIPIPGFVIAVSKRHIKSIDEFSQAEQIDFIKFLCRLRSAQRKILGVEIIYLVQEEDTSHHFNVWMFPRYDWMEEKFDLKIQICPSDYGICEGKYENQGKYPRS